MLCATIRRTPAASAASTRLRVPVIRISELARKFPPFRSVSWCITTSGAASATARRTGRVEHVAPHGLGAEAPQPAGVGVPPHEPGHRVPPVNQQRRQAPPDNPRRPGQENPHH
jgi:hypothetical protein